MDVRCGVVNEKDLGGPARGGTWDSALHITRGTVAAGLGRVLLSGTTVGGVEGKEVSDSRLAKAHRRFHRSHAKNLLWLPSA